MADQRAAVTGAATDGRQWFHGPAHRAILHLLAMWRWPARLRCHHSVVCCQYVDRPNCNNPSAPKKARHR